VNRLPVFHRDYCQGCGECAKACAPRCIELIWDFATLVRPGDCTSCGRCVEVCPEKVLRMDWVDWRPLPAAPAVPEERARPVLERALSIIRRAGLTPLQGRLDSAGILGPVEAGLTPAFDALVRRALGVPPAPVSGPPTQWLDHLYAVARSVDLRAIEIVGLRLEGCADREIAERLGTGMRLVRRIADDVGAAL
jgi:NAD-dependent dihydropyrimidine dehydrogenase PreA subunit